MGVCTFSSFGNAWTCACGHTVEDDDGAHALGCNRLSGLVQSRHDDTRVRADRLSRAGPVPNGTFGILAGTVPAGPA
jgi:hypothetical protein